MDVDSQPTMEETILVGDDLMTGPPSPIVPPDIASHVLEGVDLCDVILRKLFLSASFFLRGVLEKKSRIRWHTRGQNEEVMSRGISKLVEDDVLPPMAGPKGFILPSHILMYFLNSMNWHLLCC
ncbi:hypothetical protein L195_g020192 [Trifolium pratense]|uniref:DUF7803 domain-containing protein n=1 Tax=Trifolium pratense TaxID=57577 RepID=A0A2K3N1T3_TRIPR|nr:hypothetical protein L195_g020192 [Trifolium pratense]